MRSRMIVAAAAVLLLVGSFAAPSYTYDTHRIFPPDPHSMDIVLDSEGIPRPEVRGFTTPVFAFPGFNFSDALTNAGVSVADTYVLLRTGTGVDREMKYAALGKLNIGSGGAHGVDDKSVTTNTAHGAVVSGEASVYGFSTAGNNALVRKYGDTLDWIEVPSGVSSSSPRYLKYDGSSVSWAQIPVGSALKVKGNYNTTVATCTNTLTFASESDSDVKFRVTSDNQGNVTVYVGVYYK